MKDINIKEFLRKYAQEPEVIRVNKISSYAFHLIIKGSWLFRETKPRERFMELLRHATIGTAHLKARGIGLYSFLKCVTEFLRIFLSANIFYITIQDIHISSQNTYERLM